MPELTAIRDLGLLLSSISTLIGFPLILTFMYRLHRIRASSLKERSYKAVQDQLTALEGIEARRRDVLTQRISDLESLSAPLVPADLEPNLELVRTIRREVSGMWFIKDEGQYSALALEVFKLLGAKGRLEPGLASTVLADYESALVEQLGLLSE